LNCEHRADWRNLSLDASAPHRMISSVRAIGALCLHCELAQCTQSQGALRRICSRLGGMGCGWRDMPVCCRASPAQQVD
jgi:hypothetical protein